MKSGGGPFRSALLEIGVEEMPARFMPGALEQLSTMIVQRLKDLSVPYTNAEVWGTPRRLAVLINGLAPRAEDRTEVVLGPPPKAAKDQNGAWTQAALGFAKAQRISVESLQIHNSSKGERYAAVQVIRGQKTETVLKEFFPSLVSGLVFPKSMVWEPSMFRFVRPIRWLVALYATQIIRFKVAGVTSDKASYGLLALGGIKIPITKPEKYKTVLQGRCILVDPVEREKNIRTQIESLGKKAKGTVLADAELMQEVVHLTEYPCSILGHFPERYLKLPREVLVSVLRKHQKFFPMESSKGQLSNAFIGVRNGPSESQDDVREGYERVINARLADAQFFFEQDAETPLENLVPKLSGIGFHEKLGTLLDKTERVRQLCRQLGQALGLEKEVLERADRIATLGKADLLTHIVGEFPELQGTAGRFYAQSAEAPEVAQGIEQHYWPLTAEGRLPQSAEASLVAVADKLDTLAADFSVGLIPSGSADPYGLRRMAVGVIRVLMERGWNIDPERLISMACALVPMAAENREKSVKTLKDFFVQRFLHMFVNQGYRTDEVEAVVSSKLEGFAILRQKLESLKSIRGRPEFYSLASAIKRARNILVQAREKGLFPSSSEISPASLVEPSERSLYDAIKSVHPGLSEAVEQQKYEQALLHLVHLKEPIDAFFNGVMVMVDDPQIRSQRLLLLAKVQQLFDNLADFSKLQATAASTEKTT